MSNWLITKLGGTSVARPQHWHNIVPQLRAALADGYRLVVVHSALAGITDQLDALLAAPEQQRERILGEIECQHRDLATELDVTDLRQLRLTLEQLTAQSASLPQRPSPACRAQILAMGEYLATALFLPFLARQGLAVQAVDARRLLCAESSPGLDAARHYLTARCGDAPDPRLAERLRDHSPVILTQGFVASDADGRTVVLGRGGSDTSAAYLAAKLQAVRVDIWSDVPGLFTANPRQFPEARLLRQLGYEEALEIAATGAKVLHPRCIGPLAHAGIPLCLRYTPAPDTPGTRVGSAANGGDRPKAVCSRRGITVLSIESADMWHQAGFLAAVFAKFKHHAISVDMISTSQTTLTVTLDPSVNPLAEDKIAALCQDLSLVGRVEVLQGCVAISIVGRNIRTNLHRIAPFLEIFQDRRVHLVSQSANDLNITFVVDAEDAPRLSMELHTLLIGNVADDELFGGTWQELSQPAPVERQYRPWWHARREQLRALGTRRSPCFIYDAERIRSNAMQLQQMLTGVDQIFYSIKANSHPGVLRILAECGIGFECVSAGELRHIMKLFDAISPQRVLFTANFSPRREYAYALRHDVWLTLDNIYLLERWPEMFTGHQVIVRVDLGHGSGHHRHVRTAGASSKFGIPVADLPALLALAREHDVRIVGLHTHAGSGIRDPEHWHRSGLALAALAADIPALRIINLGGGLGVRDRPGDLPLDLRRLNEGLLAVREALPGKQLWLEPGRWLVAEAGVLLTRVTQRKDKAGVGYVGVDTGMNSLLRPALYGAYHRIVNLDRCKSPSTERYTVVGPICESGDVLGTARRMPETHEGDVLLIENAGAYGHVMSSHYNLRTPASEVLLPESDTTGIRPPVASQTSR